ncbi:AEC family transporter [uncultured Limimaricola sp.]|uniref:AEC family transporter n=1 Tax=uncultured Limimaricola sp. TaxID=2211667 RepID=UPI0030F91009
MNLILTVLEITAPVFALALIGFVWVRLGLAYDVPFVSRMAMTISVPCLIFVALMQTEIDPSALATLSLAAFASYAVLAAIFAAVVMVLRLDVPTYLAPLIFGNTGNVGLPLALFAFGQEGLGYAVVVFAVMAIGSFTFGIWLVAGRGSLGRVLREPLVWGTVLGALFLWQGWRTPQVVTNTLELTGQMAIPLMLITLGVAVARLRPGTLALSTLLSAAKIALCAGVAVALGLWFGLPSVAFAVLVLQISTPVAVTSYLLAEKYGSDAQAVAGLVVTSTLLSVIALPLILAIVIV